MNSFEDHNSVSNIGSIRYLSTIFLGNNRQVIKILDVASGEYIYGDYIISIGKKAVILTEERDGRRVPLIVKNWNKQKEKHESSVFVGAGKNYEEDTYFDTDNRKWVYTCELRTNTRWITYFSHEGKELFHFVLR